MDILTKFSATTLLEHPIFREAYTIPTAVMAAVLVIFFAFRPTRKLQVSDDTHAFIKFAQQRPPQVLAEIVPSGTSEELVALVYHLSAQLAAIQHEMAAWFSRRALVEEELVDATNKIFQLLHDDNRSLESEEFAFGNIRSPTPTVAQNSAGRVASPKAEPVQMTLPSLPTQPVPVIQRANSFTSAVQSASQQPSLRPPMAFAPSQPPSHVQTPQQLIVQPVLQPQVPQSQTASWPPAKVAAVTSQPPSPKGVPAETPNLDLRPSQWRPTVPLARPTGPGNIPRMVMVPPPNPAATQQPASGAPPTAPKSRPRPQAKAIIATADPFASRA
jgi:hypothetical protein